LDAAHPDNPLPRTPVNNDLFHVQEGGDPLHTILTDLLQEGSCEYIEVGLEDYHGQHKVVSAKASDTGVPDTLLKGIWDLVGDESWEHYVGLLPYKDRNGTHQRDALIMDYDIKRVIVYDLGKKLCVVGMLSVAGVDYRPLPATTLEKGEDYFFTIAKHAVEKYMTTLTLAAYHHPLMKDLAGVAEATNPTLRTYEVDMIDHDRWLRLGVDL
jgi:Fe-S cluster biosynthesis and repair protein YggX